MPGTLILITVTMKFIAPNKEATPAKCKLKIAKSTDAPPWNSIEANGG
jgi:hypothetical protein